MHNPDYTPNSTLISGGLHLQFTPHQEIASKSFIAADTKLSDLIKNKVENEEFFYSIEISAHNFGGSASLDYNAFGSFLPLFTSLIWFGLDYAQIDPINRVESVHVARELESRTNVLPHFTAYRADKKRLSQFLDLNFRNVLVLRGDQIDPNQEFKYAADMVAKIRELRGDGISIGVGGYPEGHADSQNLNDDIEFLAKKVDAGADFIITQLCFSTEAIISFVRRCREKGIKVPILLGVFVPDNFRSLKRMMGITGATMSEADLSAYKELKDDREKFQDFAVERATEMISKVLDSGSGIYGIHFFTLNRFAIVQRVLQKLNEKTMTKRKDELEASSGV